MGLRLFLVKNLIRLSSWLKYLVIIILPPEGIVNLAKEYYSSKSQEPDTEPDSGLNELEEEILRSYLKEKGDILILGCGAGRESIAFAKLGFRVVGIDMIGGLVHQARQEATRQKMDVKFFCREFSDIALNDYSFDYVLFSAWMYAHIPGRKRRIEVLRYLKERLRTQGKIIFHFMLAQPSALERKLYPLHKAIGLLSFGNTEFQLGDRPDPSVGFIHYFNSPEGVFKELADASLICEQYKLFADGRTGYVVAVKK